MQIDDPVGAKITAFVQFISGPFVLLATGPDDPPAVRFLAGGLVWFSLLPA